MCLTIVVIGHSETTTERGGVEVSRNSTREWSLRNPGFGFWT